MFTGRGRTCRENVAWAPNTDPDALRGHRVFCGRNGRQGILSARHLGIRDPGWAVSGLRNLSSRVRVGMANQDRLCDGCGLVRTADLPARRAGHRGRQDEVSALRCLRSSQSGHPAVRWLLMSAAAPIWRLSQARIFQAPAAES